LRTTDDLPAFTPTKRSFSRTIASRKSALWVVAALAASTLIGFSQRWQWWQSPVSASEQHEACGAARQHYASHTGRVDPGSASGDNPPLAVGDLECSCQRLSEGVEG
jgi:hypothetical protein